MDSLDNLQPELRQRALGALEPLAPAERETRLIKNWMSHDARWFRAVAGEIGMAATNRINQSAARELGQVEAQRIVRALALPPAATLDGYLLAQEIFISLLGPDLLDYRIAQTADDTCAMYVDRCFAHENAVRAGIAAEYECGVFARVMGWLDALGLAYTLAPALGPCMKCQGRECVYSIRIRGRG
jgi:hypothetical protein